MTITQLIQNSPAKANELFNRLADTSEGAVKTREKLLSELKEELELLTRLEEQHLFPVLKKHKETKDLVADAVNDNKQVKALLAELEQMPKNDAGFGGKLAELKKVFQQHVRDEKKELLPAVRKALSDEEAQSIVEKIETDKTETEEAKRQDAEQRKAEAKREREENAKREAEAEEAKRREAEQRKAEARREREENAKREAEAEEAKRREAEQQKTEAERQRAEAKAREGAVREATAVVTRSAENATQGTLRVVEAGSTAAQAASNVASEGTRQVAEVASRTTEQAVSSAAEVTRLYSKVAQPSMRNIEAFANLPGATAHFISNANRIWIEWATRTAENNARATQKLLTVKSPQQFAQAQSELLQDAMKTWMEAGSKMFQLSIRASGDLPRGE